ncbi:MAG: hypothetical protein ACTHOG_10565 [Marmoricola sp.]
MLKRPRPIAVAAVAAALVAVVALVGPAEATVTNTSPRGIQNCNPRSASISSACLSGALRDFNAARAKEHLGRLILPTNFRSLTVPQQLLVLTNLDRRARGLAPFIGLNATLNRYAAHGAATRDDPAFPSWTRKGGSNWSSTYNSLWTEYLWMYYDGSGGANAACSPSHTSYCWLHRRNVLAAYAAPRVMGAGGYSSSGDAALYLGSDAHDTTFTFRWTSEARYFPGGRLP